MRITANMVTMLRIVLMPIPAYLLYRGTSELFAALIMIIILGLTDWIDGIMARREGPSVLGGLLDPIADKIFIATIFLPLTERGVIPVWMTACIFARDFILTTLRTSLLLRDAPMRTSTLAKFKTAAQMIGIGYVILYLAHSDNPDSAWVWSLISTPIAFPLGLILYRLFKRKKQGPRSRTLLALMTLALAIRGFLGPELAIIISLWFITAMTVVSGFSYLVDAWSALKGTPGNSKELLLFFLDGLLVPVSLVLLLGRYDAPGMSALIILIVTLELTVGGLGNLLGSQKIAPRYRWMAFKSLLQVGLAAAALALWYFDIQTTLPIGEACIVAATVTTSIYVGIAFWRHRAVYISAI
ncbi:MAG: CDP-alcohol phosphatidyltransferase family protein [Deltaproteobacteria bacterium]|nr:CDP-alcohol phosphatidyltransferase family protein [Deltaproteobacteria bacterium]